jgi:hypothetical protein
MIRYIKLFLRCSKILLVLFLGATVYFGWRTSKIRFDFTMESLFRSESAERKDYEWFRKNFGSDDAVIFVAYKAPDVLSARMREYSAHLTKRLGGVAGIRGVFGVKDAFDFYAPYVRDEKFILSEITTNPLFRGNVISDDGRTTCLWVIFDPDVDSEEERAGILEEVRRILEEEERASGLRFHAAGIPVIEHEYVNLTKRDILTFMPLAIAIFLLLLCIYFRNVMGTFLPLATVGMAVLWTVGLMQIFGIPFSILSSIVPNLILIVGIADAIHFLTHYREAGQFHSDKREALARTILVMVPACFLTSFTTSVGFASLATTDVAIVQEFGILTAVGIMIAFLVTVDFLPSALDNLPPFRGRVFDNFARQVSDRVMDGIAKVNRDQRWCIFLVAGAMVAFSVVGITRIRRESSWLQDIRHDNPVHRAHTFFEENLTPVITVDLILRTDRAGAMHDLERLRKAEELQAYIRTWVHPRRPEVHVTQTLSYTDLLKELNRARRLREANPLQALVLAKDPRLRKLPETQAELETCLGMYGSFAKGSDLVARLTDDAFTSSRISVRIRNLNSNMLEDFVRDVRARHADGFEIVPTGKSWLAKRAMDNVITNMASSLGVAALIIFASMTVLFRSFRVGLLSIIPNALPMAFVGGLMGWLGIPLNFSTITVFSIALGIAVDTTIHYLARLRVEVAVDGDHAAAMGRTLRGAGRAMIFSTILLVLGFGSILTSSFKFTFYFGLLGGAALLAALICDLFVTPALMLTFHSKAKPKPQDLDRKVTEIMRKS